MNRKEIDLVKNKRIQLEPLRQAVKYWYLPSIVGFVFLLVNTFTLYNREDPLAMLVLFFGISFFLCGILEITFALINRIFISNWALHLTNGVITIISGLLLLMSDDISTTLLVYAVGFMIFIRSFLAISFTMNIKNLGSANWPFMLLLSVVGLFSSSFLLYSVSSKFEVILSLIRFNLFLSGLFYIYFSLQLKDLHKLSNEPPIDFDEGLKNLADEMYEDFEKRK
ncbi:HdeD family acid-resistance protein [Dokdonia genika]|uniref:HdeD family acid-resistance protein n=1 Tax=Dokdonia genika TaxID=308113 RepID=A0ABV9L7V8_9FLAO